MIAKNLIKIESPSCIYRFSKNIAVALLFPFGIYLLIYLSFDEKSFSSFIKGSIIILPYAVPLIIYKLYRLKYNITKVEVTGNEVHFCYEYFCDQRFMRTTTGEFTFLCRRDKSTIWEYYVLELRTPSLEIKQYQYDGWNKEAFSELVTLLKEAGVQGQSELQ